MPKHRKRRRSSSSSSSESENEVEHQIKKLKRILDKRLLERKKGAKLLSGNLMEMEKDNSVLDYNNFYDDSVDHSGNAENIDNEEVPEQEESITPLDEETLKILGYDKLASKKVGEQIHQNVAEIWNNILQSGLPLEIRSELINKYPPFANCILMEAPKLNVEVKRSVSEATIARDSRVANVQSRICAGMSALGGVLELLLLGDLSPETSRQLIERTSDATRIFADVHFDQSQARRGLLKGALNKRLAETLSEISGDGWLFGSNLPERIKAAKALDRTSEELRMPSGSTSANVQACSSRWTQTTNIIPREEETEQPASLSTQPEQDEQLPPPLNMHKAGRLRFFVKYWEMITNNPIVLSWIRGYELPFVKKVFQLYPPPIKNWSGSELQTIKRSINNLLDLGAISSCTHCDDQFLSSIFLVPKSDGSHRFILNLKYLNKFLQPDHFKLEDRTTVMKLVQPECFMGTIDLMDAYFMIPIADAYKHYLRFLFDGNLYEFNCLPFGLSTAPFVFTKIMKPVVTYLRSRGFVSAVYLDDFWLTGNSYDNCLKNIHETSKLLTQLGFIINVHKSKMIPSRICSFLGFEFNSQAMTLALPLVKQNRIKILLNTFLSSTRFKIRDLARLIGTLCSICPAT
ncbi:hypothetical protein NQ314_007150, partial [Rhamnusium bicolor]